MLSPVRSEPRARARSTGAGRCRHGAGDREEGGAHDVDPVLLTSSRGDREPVGPLARKQGDVVLIEAEDVPELVHLIQVVLLHP